MKYPVVMVLFTFLLVGFSTVSQSAENANPPITNRSTYSVVEPQQEALRIQNSFSNCITKGFVLDVLRQGQPLYLSYRNPL